MATIGLKYLVAAKSTESATASTFANGFVIGKAIKADFSIESNDTKLYADDAVAESDRSFKSGKITLGVDNLTDTVLCSLLGHTQDETSSEVTSKSSDVAPYVGVGFYATKLVNNKKTFRAIWLQKVQFGEPNESVETKGETVAFQTPTIEGTIMVDVASIWKVEKTFDTEADAKSWLDEKARITAA